MPTDTAMTLEDVLVATLDDNPGDLATRSALADLYEEQDRHKEAEGQRWLIRERKCPTYKHKHFNHESPWDWWGENSTTVPDHARVPDDFYQPTKPIPNHKYTTRTLAEQAYIDWARSVGLLKAD